MRTLRLATTALSLSALLAVLATQAAAQDMGQPADVVENFPTADSNPSLRLLLAENAHLIRGADGLSISMQLMTPVAGTYTYPLTVPVERQAMPEAFTGWAFVFNHPENCVTNPEPPRCGPEDFNDSVKFGVYNFAGQLSSLTQHSGGDLIVNEATGGYVVLSGDVKVGQQQLPVPPDAVTFPLENPAGAEVHAAIAPHGQIDPSTLPNELYIAAGNPTCGCWWVAIFLPPAQP